MRHGNENPSPWVVVGWITSYRVKALNLRSMAWEGITRRPIFWWRHPGHDVIKVNINGCYDPISKLAGVGGLFHNSMGHSLLYFSLPVEAHCTLHVEYLALSWAIRLISHVPSMSFWLESDLAILINNLLQSE